MGEVAPTDNWPKRVAAPDSLAQACSDSVEAEIQNDGMYTQLLERVFDPQARAVMLRPQEASRSRHYPTFRRCLERETRGGRAGALAAVRAERLWTRGASESRRERASAK
jgi:rubrerythrin